MRNCKCEKLLKQLSSVQQQINFNQSSLVEKVLTRKRSLRQDDDANFNT